MNRLDIIKLADISGVKVNECNNGRVPEDM